MGKPLIDPKLLDSLGFIFNKEVTIQEPTVTQNGFGEETSTWADKEGHIKIPCVLSPSGGQEVKGQDMTYTKSTHKILLQGYFPAITSTMRAVSGGQIYDILLPESDSQDLSTTLQCQIVR